MNNIDDEALCRADESTIQSLRDQIHSESLSSRQKAKSSFDHSKGCNTYFGILAKPGVTIWNILSIFLIQFFIILVNDDYMSLTQGLLMHNKYFNLTKEDATYLQSESQSITTVPSVLVQILGGFVYDILGRR